MAPLGLIVHLQYCGPDARLAFDYEVRLLSIYKEFLRVSCVLKECFDDHGREKVTKRVM